MSPNTAVAHWCFLSRFWTMELYGTKEWYIPGFSYTNKDIQNLVLAIQAVRWVGCHSSRLEIPKHFPAVTLSLCFHINFLLSREHSEQLQFKVPLDVVCGDWAIHYSASQTTQDGNLPTELRRRCSVRGEEYFVASICQKRRHSCNQVNKFQASCDNNKDVCCKCCVYFR